MLTFKDQMNNIIRLDNFPKRIISLVPSQTELLYHLNLEQETIGITKFCIHPNEWYQGKQRIGGTKNVNIQKIKDLNPDLIIGNKEENTKEDIEQLKTIAPVWMSDINSFDESIEMILGIGAVTNRVVESQQIVREIQENFKILDRKNKKTWTFLYFIWRKPFFTAGKNTFIDDMIKKCGGKNLQEKDRYPEWNFSTTISPDFILLSSEPYPFKDKHIKEFKEMFPNSKIMLVDGEFFSWYGSRMRHAPNYFSKLLDQMQED